MERTEIRIPAWKIILLIAGMLAFVLAGFWMILDGDGLFEQAMGLIAIVFFGGFGGYALYALRRGQGKVALLTGGVEIGLPGMQPRVLPWRDIEEIGVTKIGNQEFTTLRLASYQAWLAGISQEEEAAAVRFFRRLMLLGTATAKVARTFDEESEPLDQMLEGTGTVSALRDILAYNRAKYGAEFLLGWTMRDRSARAFAEYLEQRRQNSS